MTTRQFMLRIAEPPSVGQVRRLFDRMPGVCVEVGAFRRWAAVAVDRPAPRDAPLVGIVVAAIREVDAAGLVTIDTGPDCDIVTAQAIATRIGRHPRAVGRWLAGRGGAPGRPAPITLPGRPRYYRWGAVVAWLSGTRPEAVPVDHTAVFAAVNLGLRLRRYVAQVPGLVALGDLLESGAPADPARPHPCQRP